MRIRFKLLNTADAGDPLNQFISLVCTLERNCGVRHSWQFIVEKHWPFGFRYAHARIDLRQLTSHWVARQQLFYKMRQERIAKPYPGAPDLHFPIK